LLRGEYFVHQAFLADGFPGALAATPYHLDVAKARAILAAAGIQPGLRIALDVYNQPPYGEIAQSLQASFAQAGISLEIVPEPGGELYSKIRERSEQAAWLYWVPDYYDANSTASAFAQNREDGTKTLAWRAGWHIPAMTAATAAAATEVDMAARREDYLAIQREVQQNSPFVIAFQARNEVVVRKSVQGYREGLDGDMVYYDRISK
jgi:peptide/nickel transport system substrate-binding protein